MMQDIKVNKEKKELTVKELEMAYKQVQDACTGKIKTISGNKDGRGIKNILRKYFNPQNPVLSIDKEIGASCFTPLMTSAWLNIEEAVVELLKLGANPRYSKDNINSPLHIAVANNRELIVHHLLSVDSNMVNMTNAKGQTPFMLAIEAGHFDLVRILLEKYHANGFIKDENGMDAIDYAKKYNRKTIETYLLYFKLKKEVKNKNGKSNIKKI